MSGTSFLDGASRIGERLVREALWDGDACTWMVMVPDRGVGHPAAMVARAALGGLYQGTAGIGLFLAELHRLARQPGILKTAVAALRHAVRCADPSSQRFLSFHIGGVGAAYAAARGGSVLDAPELMHAAGGLLEQFRDRDLGAERALDVIGGAAGAIPVLLCLRRWFDEDVTVAPAVRLGDRLVVTARREPAGWAWEDSPSTVRVRCLCGYAHGASGFAHALTELYASTGSEVYRYAAEQAFAYERQFFDPAAGNWLDLRHQELAEYVYRGRIAELQERLRSGVGPPPYTPRFMNAWCHGAPGIGLARLRGLAVLGHAGLEVEARAAVATTLASLDQPGNFSLCHGHGGNCETLLVGSDILREPSLREAAESCAMLGLERFEAANRSWPTGVRNAMPDPSLMLGEAGIGYFLLRLHAPDTPSVLLPTTQFGAPPAATGHGATRDLQRAYVRAYFGPTLDRFQRLGAALDTDAAESPATARRLIQARIADEPDPGRRALLKDAFKQDEQGYALALGIDDFTAPFLRRLAKTAVIEEDALLVWAPQTRLVRTAYDWDVWPVGEAADSAGPPRAGAPYLLFRRENQMVGLRLGPLAEAVLACFERPATLLDAAAKLEADGGPRAHDGAPRFDALFRRQVEHAVAAGVLLRARKDSLAQGSRHLGEPAGMPLS